MDSRMAKGRVNADENNRRFACPFAIRTSSDKVIRAEIYSLPDRWNCGGCRIMRNFACLCCLLLLGGGCAESERLSQTLHASSATASKPGDPLPKDLRTRHSGGDWPCFLGPTGDSI